MNIQQLRAQVASLQNATMDDNKNFRSDYDEGKFDALSAVDELLDSLQEEQDLRCGECAKKSYDKGFFDGHIHDGDRIVHVDGRKVNVSRFRRVAKPLEAPVSEDLKEAMQHNAPNNIGIDDLLYWRNGFITGANWKEELFEKNRIAACDKQTEEEAEIERDFVTSIIEKEHRQPTFDDAIKYGMRLKEQQLMKDATEAYIIRNKHTKKNVLNGLDVTCDAIQNFNDGDKIKIIFIKEE